MIFMAAALFAVGFICGFVALRKKKNGIRVIGGVVIGGALAFILLALIVAGGDR